MSRNIQNSFIYTVGTQGPPGSTTLEGCTDCDFTSLQNRQILRYDSATDKFINEFPLLSGLEDVNITSPTNNNYLKYDSATSKWINQDAPGQFNTVYVNEGGYIHPAKNTIYYIVGGAGVIVDTLNVGDRFIVHSATSGSAIFFNAPNSYLTNAYTYMGPSVNPQISLTGCVIEILYAYDRDGNSYYSIINLFQHEGSVCQIAHVGKISSIYALNDIPNLEVPNPSNGQVLTYESATSKWINQNIPPLDKLENAGNVQIWDPFQSGDVLIYNDTVQKWYNVPSNFTLGCNAGTWDTTPVSLGGGSILNLNNAGVGVKGILTGDGSQTIGGLKIFNNGIKPITLYDNVDSFGTNGQLLTATGSGEVNWSTLIQYPYYNVVYTFSTAITAVPNTYYIPAIGGTVTINPFTVGQHIMITAEANYVTVNFNGSSYITNSYLGGGPPVNPSFSLLNATIELICINTSSGTYYELVRVAQSHIGGSTDSVCSLNGVKISALNKLNDIPNVNITTPTNGQVLTYNGTNWINSTPSSGGDLHLSGNVYDYNDVLSTDDSEMLISNGSGKLVYRKMRNRYYFNSGQNISSGVYFKIGNGISGDVRVCEILISQTTYIKSILAHVSGASGAGFGWTFTVYKNGVSTGLSVSCLGTTVDNKTDGNILYNQYDRLSVRITQVGGASGVVGVVSLEYF